VSEQGSTGEAPGGAAAEAVAKRARSRQVRDKGLVEAARGGDKTAFGKLYDQWVDNVYDRAINGGASAAEAREITEQTFLAAWRDLDKLKQPAAFGAKVLQVTRRETLQRVPDGPKATPAPSKGGSSSPEERLSRATNAEATAADHDVALVLREAATALDDRTREVLDLHFRQGLTRNETAAVLGDQPDKITETVTKLPPALAVLTRARVLWHGGNPEDPELAEQLKQDGVKTFNAAAVRSINRFAKDNDRARARSLIGIPPIELYAAIPLADAPAGLKMAVASTLVTEGVPMDGSGFVKRDDKGEIIDQPKRVSKTRDVGAEKPTGDSAERSIRPGLDEKRPTLDTKKAAAVAAAALLAEKQALEQSAAAAAAPAPKVEEKGSSRKDRKAAKAEKADSARAEEQAAAAAAATAAAAAAAKEREAKLLATSRVPDENLQHRDKAAPAAAAATAGLIGAEAASRAAETDAPGAKDAGAASTPETEPVTEDKTDQKDGGAGTAAAVGLGAGAAAGALTDDDAAFKADAASSTKEAGAAATAGAATTDAKGADAADRVASKDADTNDAGTKDGKGKKAAAAGAGAGAAAALAADGAAADTLDTKATSATKAGKAAAAGKTADGTTTKAKPEPKPVPVATTARTEEREGGGAGKYIAAAAVVLLLLGGLAFALTRGGDKSGGVSAGPTSTAASTTTTAKKSTSSTAVTTTSTPGASTTEGPTTTEVGPSTTASVVAPPTTTGGVTPTNPPPTNAPTTTPPTTTQSSTIVINKFEFDANHQFADYSMTDPVNAHGAPTLTWDVSGNGDLTATVTVTSPGGATSLAGTGLSSSIRVCPTTPVAGKCTAAPGTYQYKIVVHPADGSPDRLLATQFVIAPN
jgi:DNA-directed RNA polymerase specialized sigma24 family protein